MTSLQMEENFHGVLLRTLVSGWLLREVTGPTAQKSKVLLNLYLLCRTCPGTLRDWEEGKAKWAVAVAETRGARYSPPSPLSNTFDQKSHSINATSLTFPLEFIFLHFYWHHQGQHLPPFQHSCKTLLIDLPAFSFSTFIRPWTWMPDHLDYEQIKCWNMPILTHC